MSEEGLPGYREINNGAKRARTADPLHAMQVLYQLSYSPLGLIHNLLLRSYRQGIVVGF